MLKEELTKKEILEALEESKQELSKVFNAVVNDCLITPGDKEEFIEAGLTTSYRILDQAIDKAKVKYSLQDLIKLN